MTNNSETRYTVFRKLSDGRWRAIHQYKDIERAKAYMSELIEEGRVCREMKIEVKPYRPIMKKYDRRGRLRESGLPQH